MSYESRASSDEILKLDSIDEGSIDNFCSNNDVSLLSIAEASLYFQQQEIVDLCETC